MTPADCRSGDWQAVGFEDGLKGIPERLENRRQACSNAGLVPKALAFETYHEGWNEGLASYCVPDSGFVQGRRGKVYHGVCGKELEPAFLKAYGNGLLVGSVEQRHRVLSPFYHSHTSAPSPWGMARDVRR
ncbi:MAG: DUF2799 domain-containing protein [Gammaproteobacteria bacterium]|nr:DUF2799 domain-containing protein [Gammaproteobacteria bacterium]